MFQPGPTLTGILTVTIADLRPLIVHRHSATLIRLDIRGDQYDADLADPHHRGPLAALTILDELTPDRLTSLERFWAGIAGKRVAPDPRLTPQRRHRARQMLRAIDGDRAGATYRAIALNLFPQHETDTAEWVGSAVRETVIRLARDGRELVRGKYVDLMRRPRRSRSH